MSAPKLISDASGISLGTGVEVFVGTSKVGAVSVEVVVVAVVGVVCDAGVVGVVGVVEVVFMMIG